MTASAVDLVITVGVSGEAAFRAGVWGAVERIP